MSDVPTPPTGEPSAQPPLQSSQSPASPLGQSSAFPSGQPPTATAAPAAQPPPPAPSGGFCRGCGNPQDHGAVFCPNCGHQNIPLAPPQPHFAPVMSVPIAAPVGYPPAGHPPPPAGYPYPYSAPTQPKTNGFSVAGLVLGILWIYWLGSILALIFGYVAKSQIDKSNGTQGGRGMAIAAIVLGWIGVGTLTLVIILAAIGAASAPGT